MRWGRPSASTRSPTAARASPCRPRSWATASPRCGAALGSRALLSAQWIERKEPRAMKVLIEKDGPVTTVIINRPEVRNAVDPETAAALREAFRAFEKDGDALAAVLSGAGGCFCGGYDLKSLSAHGLRDPSELEGDGPMGPSRMLLSKPVIAGVDGYAVAGGLVLAGGGDLRVMDEGAQFGVFGGRGGAPPIAGGRAPLPRLIGMSRALDMILTGRAVGAGAALQ